MKFVHLSDLHIGKRVNEISMFEDQKYILSKIIEIIEKSHADAVIIAGDIYDKSVPSAEAIMVFDRFLTELSELNIYIFIISGNHDSPERLAFGEQLLQKQNIFISPVFDGDISPIRMQDEFGEVFVYLLPFIKPAHVRRVYPECEADNYSAAVKYVIDKMNVDDTKRNILVAHQLVTGAGRCDSEDISVGGMDNVDVNVFEKFDYVALGHIHGPQNISSGNIRYCGTPLKYSFSEMKHVKSVTIVELKDKGTIETDTSNELIPLHDVREIRGKYMDITDRNYYRDTNTEDYLHIILEDENDIPDVMGRLRSIYPNIMKLDYDNERTRNNKKIDVIEDLDVKTPMQLIDEFFELQNNRKMNEVQEEIVTNIIDEVWGMN